MAFRAVAPPRARAQACSTARTSSLTKPCRSPATRDRCPQVKTKGARKIPYDQFVSAVDAIAAKKVRAHAQCVGRANRGWHACMAIRTCGLAGRVNCMRGVAFRVTEMYAARVPPSLRAGLQLRGRGARDRGGGRPHRRRHQGRGRAPARRQGAAAGAGVWRGRSLGDEISAQLELPGQQDAWRSQGGALLAACQALTHPSVEPHKPGMLAHQHLYDKHASVWMRIPALSPAQTCYTGVYAKGGPTNVDMDPSSLASVCDRTPADARGVKVRARERGRPRACPARGWSWQCVGSRCRLALLAVPCAGIRLSQQPQPAPATGTSLAPLLPHPRSAPSFTGRRPRQQPPRHV